LQRDENQNEGMRKTAVMTDRAARVVEQALVPVEKTSQSLLAARRQRDVKGRAWGKALDCLKSEARTVAKSGMPDNFTALVPTPPGHEEPGGGGDPPAGRRDPGDRDASRYGRVEGRVISTGTRRTRDHRPRPAPTRVVIASGPGWPGTLRGELRARDGVRRCR